LNPLGIAIIVVVAAVVGAIMFILGQNKERSNYARKVGTAEEKSREIIDDAIRTAENKKRVKTRLFDETYFKRRYSRLCQSFQR